MAEEAKFFYANAMQMATSIYDVSLIFLRNGAPAGKAGKPGDIEEVHAVALDTFVVSMSPSHAKAMLPALVKTIRDYERQHGSIPVPPETTAAWADQIGGAE